MTLRWEQGNSSSKFLRVPHKRRFNSYRTRRQHKKMFHVKQYLERTRVLTTRGGDDKDTDRKEAIDVHTQAVPQIIVLSCNDKGYKK